MTAKTWADPEPLDLTASSGTVTIDTTPPSGTPDRSYFKLSSLPRGRIYQLAITNGTGTLFTDEYGDWTWRTFNPAYPQENVNTGSHSPYSAEQSIFYCAGIEQILAIRMVTHGTVTLTWTSVDWALRPYTWSDADPMALPSGTLTFDGLHKTGSDDPMGYKFGQERHYVFTPTSADPIALQTNEPNGYYEVYRETNAYTFDDYIDDGYNLSDGTPDPDGGNLAFTPEIGQTYHLVIYPNGLPTTSTAYTLTWNQGAGDPPPYFVANDNLANAEAIGELVDGLIHHYDNTGATEDSAELPGLRSIWYSFTLAEERAVRIQATASVAGGETAPAMRVCTPTGTIVYEASAYLSTYLAAGSYLLQIHFPGSGSFSPWDSDGTLVFGVKPRPVYDLPGTPYELPPGDVSAGGGQNYRIGSVFGGGPTPDGAGPGSSGVVQIRAPFDGGLSLIIEAGSEGGSVIMPDVDVELPYAVETGELLPGDIWEAQAVTLKTTLGDPLHPLQMPWRAVGATDPEPVTFTVSQGDVITVRINYAISGCYIRWGMSTTTGTPSGWVSARYGDYVTYDGAETPAGMTTDEAADVRANAVAWPLEDPALGQRPNDLPGYLFDIEKNPARRQMRWDLGDNQRSLTLSASDDIDWANIEPMLDAATHGGNAGSETGYGGPTRETDDWPTQTSLGNTMGGRVMFDPATAKTITEMGTSLRLIRQQAYALHDKRYEAKVNDGSDVWHPLSPVNARAKEVLSALRPVVLRAQQGTVESTRPWYDPALPGVGLFADDGNLARMLTWKVEWGDSVGTVIAEPKEVYNLYRWTHAISANRQVRDPYASQTLPFNQIESNPDYPASSPWPTRDVDLTAKIYSIAVEITDDAWVPPEVIAAGELCDEFVFPSQSVIESPPVLSMDGAGKDRDIGGHTYAFEDTLYQIDIFHGSKPGPGAKFYDNVYAAMMSPYEASYFPWGPTIGAYWDVRGYVNGPPYQFTLGSFFYNWSIAADFRTMAARQYPDQFRVALWEPSLAALPAPGLPPLPIATGESTGSDSAGDYVYLGDVGVGVSPPILWFLYKKWGFLGDHVVAYGQALGNTAAALHGVLKIGPGLEYPIVADVAPSVTNWQLNTATSHAYDGTGVIYPGTEVAPPRVDAEVQTVEFIIPSSLVLDGPTECHVYVTNDNGRSNMLTLMIYPMVDLNMQSADPLLLTSSSAMGVFGRVDEDVLEQRYSLPSTAYAITGRIPERPPVFLTNAVPVTTFTAAAPTSGLDDPVDVTVPLALRYRPVETKIEPRPDLGTGASVWNSNEGSSMDLKFLVDSAPYVDDTTTISSRNGDLVRPAMVFPGDAWMETTNGFGVGPRLTLAMAVTVYADPQPRSYLLSSFVSGAPDPDTFPLEVYVEGDQISLHVGQKIVSAKIAPGYIGRRPILVVLSVEPKLVRAGFVSDTAYVRYTSHLPLNTSGLKLYLGRCNDAGNLRMATMDVLDLSLDTQAAGLQQFWQVINSLDSAYGVMK